MVRLHVDKGALAMTKDANRRPWMWIVVRLKKDQGVVFKYKDMHRKLRM